MAKTSTEKAKKYVSKKTRRKTVSTETDRHRSISEAAYYKAERRDFAPGFDQQDWYEAEREVDGW